MAQTYNDAVPASTRNALEDLTAIRNNFAALKSCFSGATAPPNPVAGMWWYDTTANMLKIRNEANNAWLNVYDFANGYAIGCSNTVLAGTGIAVSGSLRTGNVTVGLSSGGVGATQLANGAVGATQLADGAVNPSKLSGYTAASTYLIISVDPEVQVGATSYAKYREIRLDKGGSLRITFDLYCAGSGNDAHARIYRNGSAVGTARERTAVGWQTFTEDISGWSAGDLVQLYAYHDLAMAGKIRNFRIYSGTWPVLEVVI